MFGDVSPTVRNLLTRPSKWFADQNFAARLPATSSATAAQVSSPAHIWEGQGFASGTSRSHSVYARVRNVPASLSSSGTPVWTLDLSQDGTTWSTTIQSQVGDTESSSISLTTLSGRTILNHSSSGGVGSYGHLTLNNPSGAISTIGFRFASTYRAAITSSSSGNVTFHAVGSGGNGVFNFNYGSSSIFSTLLSTQIGSFGVYSNFNGFFAQKVTAGSADTSAIATLNSYGSSAAKGVRVTNALYTVADETFVYLDPANESCIGTATACSTYVSEGTCNTHSEAGCSWFSGTSCSIYFGDQSSCEGQAGCTWESASCFGPGDQTSCEDQNTAYGGSCAWDTSTCSGMGDQSSCEAVTGCSWYADDCGVLNPTDQFSCEGLGCGWTDNSCSSYDGDQSSCEANGCFYNDPSCVGLCSGEYNASCSGEFCTNTYNTGNCNGSFGAACQGTASCSNIDDSVTCAAESGCSWVQGQTITLPTTATAHRSNTGKFFDFVHIGDQGIATISANTGQSIFQYGSTISLYKKGDRVRLHFHNVQASCSEFVTEGACTPTGCSWANGCAAYGDETSCNEVSGCSWSEEDGCTGNYSCTGSYDFFTGWFASNVERGDYFSQQTNVTVANTVTETTLVDSSGQGSLSIPANFLAIGNRIRIKAQGIHSSTGNPTITVKIKLGGTTICSFSGVSGNGTNNGFVIDGDLRVRSIGASGTVLGQGFYQELHNNGLTISSSNTSTSTIDTTGSLTLDVTVQWGTASAGNTITCTSLFVTIDNR